MKLNIRKKQLKNLKFNRLTVLHEDKPHIRKNSLLDRYWLCRCDCGKVTSVYQGNLISGHTNSCGCWQKDVVSKHKEAGKTSEYQSWESMRARVNNPNHKHYSYYGGRGISICDRWNDYCQFLNDMGRKPSPKHTIDRINPNGNYEPENCRWATSLEQARNKRWKWGGKK